MSSIPLSKAERYNRTIFILAACAVLLAVVYLLTLFFDPERVAVRSASFTWLPREGRDAADRVEISGSGAGRLVLVKRDGAWFAENGTEQVPVKQGRIDDLFRVLSSRGAFPRRGSSASSHQGLGLASENAARLIIRGGASVEPILDLLVGDDDASGNGVYLRKNGENEYRSGDPLIKSYVTNEKTAWYDLKLFRDNQADFVQRVQVSPVKDGDGDEDYALARNGGAWVFEGFPETPQSDMANTYIQNIFNIQGDDFLNRTDALGTDYNAARIRLELGDGSVITIQAADEHDQLRPVMVSGSSYLYLFSTPAVKRLFWKRSSLL